MFRSGFGRSGIKAPSAPRPKISRAPKASLARDGFGFQSDFYQSQEWQDLCKAAKERDGYKCRRCPCTIGLQVHHIRSRNSGGLDVLANLITLCFDCHSLYHRHLSR
jgi:hypothetical protein